MIKYITKNIDETIKIAYNLATDLKKSDVICLTGELGAGKTVFMSGIAKYFNIQDEISSPTFTIANEYNIKAPDFDKLYHFDVYRLANVDEFIAIGGLEYFEYGVCIIEWGEIIQNILPKNTIYINITKDENDENIRYIEIRGGKYENLSN